MNTPAQRHDHLDALAVGILLVSCVFWGAQQVLVKLTLPELPPVMQAAIRCIGAAGLLLLWCRWHGIALFGRDGSLRAGVFTACLFSAEFACIYLGLQHTSASRLTVFLYTAPFWVAALLPLFVKSERLRPMQWLGLGCAFVAVVFALREGLVGESGHGDVLGLLAGVALSALSLALGETWTWTWSPFAWFSVAVQTGLGAFASYLAWMWLLGRYPATKVSVFVFLTPLFALLFGHLLLGEAVTPTLLVSLALVAGGIVLVNRQPDGDPRPR